MADIAKQLVSLAERIAAGNDPDMPAAYLRHLAITQTGTRFNLDFYGESFEECYFDLLSTIAQPEIAPHIRSVILRGPDEGTNGTHNWDIGPLLETDTVFSELETFGIQLNQPGDHNRSIIGADYDEDGVLARLLTKSPKLRELTVPSAPNAAFFDVGQRPIRFLSVDAGYATQGFISNLAKSSCFPHLNCIDWGEYNETYLDDYRTNCTPTDNYRELFQSDAFARVARFVWRNPACTDDDIKKLKELKPGLQLLVVRFSDHYA